MTTQTQTNTQAEAHMDDFIQKHPMCNSPFKFTEFTHEQLIGTAHRV